MLVPDVQVVRQGESWAMQSLFQVTQALTSSAAVDTVKGSVLLQQDPMRASFSWNSCR